MQKIKESCQAVSNYRPITCLLFLWKFIAGVIAEKIYEFLDINLLLPQEKKVCRRNRRGPNDLMFIDEMIIEMIIMN